MIDQFDQTGDNIPRHLVQHVPFCCVGKRGNIFGSINILKYTTVMLTSSSHASWLSATFQDLSGKLFSFMHFKTVSRFYGTKFKNFV